MASTKSLIFTILFLSAFLRSQAQPVVLPDIADSLFPVTNTSNVNYYPGIPNLDIRPVSVFKITPHNGKYYLFGNFTNLAVNHGAALVIDTAAQVVRTPQKWRINGVVKTAIADGQGGFYIGGTFTTIGDSTRRYLAQIDSFGQPRPWNPRADSFVNQISRRNDTLFIGGVFFNIFNKDKPRFAMYSITGDSLLNNGGFGPFFFMSQINSFLIDKDTIIYAGETGSYDGTISTQPIRKYNFRNNSFPPWVLLPVLESGQLTPEYGPVSNLQFNKDSSAILYISAYNGTAIKAVNKLTGARLYKLLPSFSNPSAGNGGNSTLGTMKVVGDKAYIAGAFDRIINNAGAIDYKSAFAAFNASTGVIAPDIIPVTGGYPFFIEQLGGKLYVSGKFTAFNGVPRTNFAVLDTANLAVTALEVSPTDAATTLALSNGNFFLAGYFSGIKSVARNGFAAIDSATNAVLPWNPQGHQCIEGKRMFAKGDSLFALGITSRPSSCMVNDYNTQLKVISLSTGAEYSTQGALNIGEINDLIYDNNYLYVSGEKELRRFSFPSLIKDPSWGFNFAGYGGEHTPTYLVQSNDTIYSVGDNRFVESCTNLISRKAYVIKYPKSTGFPAVYYNYAEANQYTQPVFERAVLVNKKLYVQGVFASLNGNARRDYVCINTENGAITGWQPSFANPVQTSQINQRVSDLMQHAGKIWFGCPIGYQPVGGGLFSGFGSLDTTTAALTTPPLITLDRQIITDNLGPVFNPVGTILAEDFILNNNEFIVTGNFHTVNGKFYRNLVRYRFNGGIAGITYTFVNSGNWSDAANWSNNMKPPAVLPNGSHIIINTIPGGECILNLPQTIAPGGKITISTGKKLLIPGNLIINN